MILSGESKRRAYREAGWWGDKTLADLFFANAEQWPDRPALIDAPNREDFAFGGPQGLTWGGPAPRVEPVARGLVGAGGVGRDPGRRLGGAGPGPPEEASGFRTRSWQACRCAAAGQPAE